MIGRNDQCPCGSGKKYKKCCEGKEQATVTSVFNEEIEAVLQNFYVAYPERKDVREFYQIVQTWKSKLQNHLQRELIEAIALDEFFFHVRPDIWTGYLKRTIKKMVRPSTVELLEKWAQPQLFIGKVELVEERYFKATHTLTLESYMIRRENNKPIPEGMQVFAFILPDGSGQANQMLAVSTLIFFPATHAKIFDGFAKGYNKDLPVEDYLKDNHLNFWMQLVDGGYAGEEFTPFETDVLEQTKSFLEERGRNPEKLIIVLEDYLVEQQPTARKAAAIAAGAIRFGQEHQLFDGQAFTVKEIAEGFGVSASSLNKYYQDLLAFQAVTV